MDVPLSLCPHCHQPGRVILIKGKMTRRRICDSCRDSMWDVNGEQQQLMLRDEESVVNYTPIGKKPNESDML